MIKTIKTKAFTLIELLLVITIITVLATTVMLFLKPFEQIEKSFNIKRKQELSSLQKAFNDYYNDKNFFPNGAEICYSPITPSGNTCSCFICGLESVTSLPPYINRLPCDPQHGKKDYLYQYDCSNKQWYKIYTLIETGSSLTEYNYGTSSGNTPLNPYPTIANAPTSPPVIPPTSTPASIPSSTPAPTLSPTPTITLTPTPTTYYCPSNQNLWCIQTILGSPVCNFCGYLASCISGSCDDEPFKLFSDSWCSISCSQ